jgi:hypothetical protein
MVVYDFDIGRSFIRPHEAEPPLIIDSDAILSFAITAKDLESISRNACQRRQRGGGVQHDQPSLGLRGECLEFANSLATEYGARALIPKRADHKAF